MFNYNNSMFKKILNLFAKNKADYNVNNERKFDINQTALVLAYEVARSDGDVDQAELDFLKSLIDENESRDIILKQLKEFSDNSSSFYDHIKDINNFCSKDQKEGIIRILWDVAYSDNFLEVHEEKIVRRIGSLINIKDVRILRLKNDSKFSNPNN